MPDIYISLVGTLLAAIIGALTLLFIAHVTTTKVHENFRADKLAEAKRDAYLNLIDCWMRYLLEFNSFRIRDIESHRMILFQSSQELISAMHKSSFISEPTTKKEIIEFSIEFSKQSFILAKALGTWYQNKDTGAISDEKIIMDCLESLGLKAMSLQIKLREELGINNNEEIDDQILDLQMQFSKNVRQKLFGEI